MTREVIIEQLNLAIDLIKQDGKDWLDERDIPMLEYCVKALSQDNKNIKAILECYFTGFKEEIIDSACNRILDQEKTEQWIPVSYRLPETANVYIVTRYYPADNVMDVDACFFDGSNTWYDDNRINRERAYVDNVIAWQENPEPYKVASQESEE